MLTPNELDLSFQVPNDYAKFRQTWMKIATTGGYDAYERPGRTD